MPEAEDLVEGRSGLFMVHLDEEKVPSRDSRLNCMVARYQNRSTDKGTHFGSK